MHLRIRTLAFHISWLVILLLLAPTAHAVFNVSWGDSWDGVLLQDIIDGYLSAHFPSSYSPGDINVLTMYEGYVPGGADLDPTPYWEDSSFNGLIVEELAGYRNNNTMGWYEIGSPVIDGFNDGVIFEGSDGAGTSKVITFPTPIRFGFWLDPNGELDSRGAPQPERFYTDRTLNDVGPDGSGTIHPPENGDPQCLIYNASYLYGRPAYILAWEDIDYGLEVSATPTPTTTDNDFNDLVVLIMASSPVPTETNSWGEVKALFSGR